MAAKDLLDVGDRIFLPITVQALPSEKQQCSYNEEEINFIRSLLLYKVINLESVSLKLYYALSLS